MEPQYSSDCTNVYDVGTAGDGYPTMTEACKNCSSASQYLANNYTLGGSCQPYSDNTGSGVGSVNDGTYGFASDGINWYYEQSQIGSDHASPQNACTAPYNPYAGQNFQQVGTCSAQTTEGFELFGMTQNKSALVIALLLILVIVVVGLYLKYGRK